MNRGKLLLVKKNSYILAVLIKDNSMIHLSVANEAESILGNIYIGKIQKMVPGLNGAFVEVSKGIDCYLSLSGHSRVITVNQKKDERIKAGDEIVVQVTAESIKTKLPAVSPVISLPGQYCVVTSNRGRIVFSSKITAIRKKEIKSLLSVREEEAFEIIVRTNADKLKDFKLLTAEIDKLQEKMQKIIGSASYRTCYSCLFKEQEPAVKLIRDIPESEYDEIITDEDSIYKALTEQYGDEFKSIRLYRDENYSLMKLYSVESHLEKALGKKVWLDSGGFLYIEPTEALTVIDVNTGKSDNKKQSSFLKINLEAAAEIARQIRVRNLSGIVIIDFINMDEEEEKNELLSFLSQLLKKDPVKTNLVDMTPLGLVEITRKKTSKPIRELFALEGY